METVAIEMKRLGERFVDRQEIIIVHSQHVLDKPVGPTQIRDVVLEAMDAPGGRKHDNAGLSHDRCDPV